MAIVEFEGQSGNGSNINLNVPMPGTHTGRRLIVLQDIPDEAWNTAATETGTPWGSFLGVTLSETGYFLSDISRFTQLWASRSASVALPDVDKDTLTTALLELEADALAYRQSAGSMKEWAHSSPLLVSKRTISPPSDGVGPIEPTAAILQKIATSVSQLDSGIIRIPSQTWAGTEGSVSVNLNTPAMPRLILVQVYGISPFLGDYGLGRTVKTFTLLPGEETKISTRTWRSTVTTTSEGSSIVDSYDSSVGASFGATLYDETTDTSTQSSTENWSAEAEASGNWGVANASVSGSASGEYSSSSEEFAKTTSETVSESAYSASSARQNTVTSSSEYSETTESELVTERTIKNINVKRVLNFVFRELNQEYIVKTHLKDIRIAFANGNAGCWREVPISGLRGLLAEVLQEGYIDQTAQDILSTISTIFDLAGDPVSVLEMVKSTNCGDSWEISEAKRGANCAFDPPTSDGTLFYRFRRGNKADAYALNQEDEEFKVPGVLMRETTVVMRTDSVVVEALLGTSDALDDYNVKVQDEATRTQTLANSREELAQDIIRTGDSARAALFQSVFMSSTSTEISE